MVAPVSPNMTSVSSDTAPVTVVAEVATPQVSQPVQADKPTVSEQNQAQSSQDTVELSATALDMSKALNKPVDNTEEQKNLAVTDQTQSAEKEGNAYVAAGKKYPPFMGNSEELSALKESSPALYREILRMIVPPPLDLSPTDRQMLESAQSSVSATKSALTAA
jgi:hypothetical protein